MDLASFYLLCSLMGEPDLEFNVYQPPLSDYASILLMMMLVHFPNVSEEQAPARVWKVPRCSTHWDDIQREILVLDDATRDALWRTYYRMSYSLFYNLVEELRPFISVGQSDYVRAPVELDKAVAMVLHRLANGYTANAIGDMYNMGSSTVRKYTKMLTEILSNKDKLYSRYVHIPDGIQLTRIITRFKVLTDLPNMCGVIDGTHVKLSCKPPRHCNPKDYWSKHGIYSILLQGVCDTDLVFWDLCCNAPGGEHDANHFSYSPLWQKLCAREVLAWPKVQVKNTEIQPYLVADSCYKPAPFVVKPFMSKKGRSVEFAEFDKLLKRGQSKAEDAFALLKSRWQILKNVNVGLGHAAQVAVACGVLHNFCQLNGEPQPDDLGPDIFLNNNSSAQVHTSSGAAEIGRLVRDSLFRDWLERRGAV